MWAEIIRDLAYDRYAWRPAVGKGEDTLAAPYWIENRRQWPILCKEMAA